MRLVGLLVFLALAACGPSAGTPGQPALVAMSLGTPAALTPGTTIQLVATGSFEDGSSRDVTSQASWSSDLPETASIDAGGLVTGELIGEATIEATIGDVHARTIVAVVMGALEAVTIEPGQLALAKGQHRPLIAYAMYAGAGQPVEDDSATWTTSDATIAAIDDPGTVVATGVGTATITATLGAFSGSAQITVGPAVLESLAIEPDLPHLPLGLTLQLAATGTFTDATAVDPSSVTWESSNPAAATIAATGLVTPVALGTTTITARVGTVFATTDLTVTAASLVSIALTPNPASVVPGDTIALAATGTLSDTTTIVLTQNLTWSTSDATTATVTTAGTRGVVGGVAIGDVTITATDGTVSGTATVHVLGLAVAAIAPGDGLAGVRGATPIVIELDQAVMPASLTAQATSGACTGSLQLSSDGFATCVGFTSTMPALDATNRIATLVPAAALTALASYRVRVLGSVANAAGVAMGTDVTQPTGFTIATDGACASSIVISQVYGGGGNAGATFSADFVELHNAGATAASLAGMSVQYASAQGTTWSIAALPSTVLPAGGFYLVQMSAAGAIGATLAPDLVATPAIAMGAVAGKVALVASAAALTGTCPLAATLDFVGYGTGASGASCFEGVAAAPTASAISADQRATGGCIDRESSSDDFGAATPAARSSATAPIACSCVANATDTVAELDYCDLQFPASLTLAANATAAVYGQVYEAGVTEAADPAPAIRVELGLGAGGTSPLASPFTWVPTTYNVPAGNNDEYQGMLAAPATAGSYSYTTRATRDGTNWTYCDLDGAGSNPGLTFDPAQLGQLTVN
ncbi:MAG: Ig-like domain-containing protein [Kofleriaceae bacterium]